jgi:hypothetical protein
MKKNPPATPPACYRGGLYAALFLAAVLALMFWRSFLPDFVHFSNDGPLGQINVNWAKLPGAWTGMWADMNETGANVGTYSLSITGGLLWLLGSVGYSKFYAAIALFIVGLGALTFFRALKFSTLAATLGALAAMLDSTFLATACWGVASQQIALGMVFFALALIVANNAETPWPVRWARLALAGLCVGVNVKEAADIGALYSLFVAAFVFVKSLADGDGTRLMKAARGAARVTVVAGFAGFIALQTILSLVGTSITGIAGSGQDTESKAQRWDWATQWSLPKKETFGLVVPGLFGYKMDTPKDMIPQVKDDYNNGVYWGGVGRDPALDRFYDSGGQGAAPSGFMRFSGGTNYCGILVLLVAAWTVAQSFRRQNSVFTETQKKFIWFWTAVMIVSLPLAWGRFAPGSNSSDGFLFYALLYKLPYFSTIRNPAKFLNFLAWALVILFGYGINTLHRRYLDQAAMKSAGMVTQLTNWWAKAGVFDRKWTYVCGGILGFSVLAWLVYSAQQPALVQYLEKMGFPDADPTHDNSAPAIAAFSLAQVCWFLVLFAGALALFTLVIAGYFAGPRAKIGAVLIGAFLLFDLGRADLPYIVHWDYKQKYEVGSLNPILETLTEKPYEHRVAALPFEPQQQLRGYDGTFGGSGIYRIEWMQHHFPYYNIQCLDIIQMPRIPEDLKAYLEALSPHSPADAALFARHWQLTNTRYLLGAAGYLDVINQQLDPLQHRFQIAQRFDIIPKPGITHPTQLEELTATTSPDGDLALFDFTGALPRAKLYANWQVNTNDQANLKTLGDLNFDPVKTVLISTPENDLPAVATNENTGTVEFKSYQPMHLVFDAQATAPSVLLLNDKYDPNWHVTVDGKPAQLLRCNFLMRGVYVPPGSHAVVFDFKLSNTPVYVTLTAGVVGLLLCGFLVCSCRRNSAPANSALAV